MKSARDRRVARAKAQAALLTSAFVLLAVAPAIPAAAQSAAPLSGGFAASSADALGVAGTVTARSPSISDDIADAPARVLLGGAAYDKFGLIVSSLGDLNGDGADELGVVSRSPAAVNVIAGARGQPGGGPTTALRLQGAGEVLGLALTGGGDLNGDGFDDFAATSSRPDASGAPVQEVQVFYGQSGIVRNFVRATIQAPSNNGTFGIGLQMLKDVDGDGFADLVITASPFGSPVQPGAVFLYRGSATGLSAVPSWSYTATDATDAFGAAVFATGDLNGDELSDFVVTTGGDAGTDGYARVFHFLGDVSGKPAGPESVTGTQRGDGFGASVAGGDFNGDGFGDLLIGSPEFDPSPESIDAGQLTEFQGSPRGLGSSGITRVGTPSARYATSVANIGDVSGDGIDDAAVGAPIASADGPFNNGQVFVYFGGATGLQTHYDMTEAGASGYDLYGAAVSSKVDIDGDGRADLALCAPGHDITGAVDAGACYVYGGLRIRVPLIAPGAFVAADLTDGAALARAEAPYHFTFTFVYRGPESALASAEETFVSDAMHSGASVRYDGVSHAVGLVSDPASLVPAGSLAQLMADSLYAPGGNWVHSFQLHASVKFAWALADPDPLTVRLTVRDQRGGESTASVDDAFPVISTLEFRTAPEVLRADGSPLGPTDWVRAGEVLTWSGGALAYTGTQTAPPAAEVGLFVVDGDGVAVPASYDGASGDLYAQETASLVDSPSAVHQVEARIPGGAVLAVATRSVPTDALTPGFGTSSPADNEVVTQSSYPVSIHVFDSGSGVDGARVEFAVSHSDPPVFTDWQSASATTGKQVVAQATATLIENTYNLVQFRAFDRVGNGPSYSAPIRLQLDYGAVDFDLVAPTAGTWVRDTTPTVTFSVGKAASPAIDLGTVEVEVNGAEGGQWHSLGLAGSTLNARFATELSLAEGTHNEVRLRARLVGHDTLYVSPPFSIAVDTLAPTIDIVGPSPGSWATTGVAVSEVRIEDASSGPAGASLQYRYLLPGMSEWSPWSTPTVEIVAGGSIARAEIPIPDGVENYVVWQASDAAGNGPTTSAYQRLMADSRPVTFSQASPRDGAHLESVSRVSILVDDGEGAGVDLQTVEYAVELPSGASSGWVNAGRTGIATRATVSVPVTLPEGGSTVRWRARDAAGTALVESVPSRVTVASPSVATHAPMLVLTGPVSGGHYRAGADVRFDAGRSFDPDGTPLFFQWSIDGRPLKTHASAFWLQLAPGYHTVTLVVSDGTQSPDITVGFTVDPPASPPGVLSSGAAQALLASFVLLVSASFGARYWAGRARRALAARPE